MNPSTTAEKKEMNTPKEDLDEASSTCVDDEDDDEVRLSEIAIPPHFLCPLTLDLIEDPLVSRHGQSYERAAIMSWLGAGNTTCPMTRKPLRLADLISDHRLKTQIDCWKEAHPEYKKKKQQPAETTDDCDTEKVLGMYFNYEGTEHSQEDPDVILEWRRPTEATRQRRRGLLERLMRRRPEAMSS